MYVQLRLGYKVRKYIFTKSGALYIHRNVEPGSRLYPCSCSVCTEYETIYMHQNAELGSRLYMYTKICTKSFWRPGCMYNWVYATKSVNLYLPNLEPFIYTEMWSRVPDCTRVRVQSVQNLRPYICTRMQRGSPDCTCIQKSVYRHFKARDVCTIESRLQSP